MLTDRQKDVCTPLSKCPNIPLSNVLHERLSYTCKFGSWAERLNETLEKNQASKEILPSLSIRKCKRMRG